MEKTETSHPPRKIRRFFVPNVAGKNWKELILSAAPETPSYSVIHDDAELYAPHKKILSGNWITLVNYPLGTREWHDSTSRLKTYVWAESRGLKPASPQQVFMLAIKHPSLNDHLGCESLRIVSTARPAQGPESSSCCIKWHGKSREAMAIILTRFELYEDWFAFWKAPNSQG